MLAEILLLSILTVLIWKSAAGLFMYLTFEDELKAKREKSLKKGSDECKKITYIIDYISDIDENCKLRR